MTPADLRRLIQRYVANIGITGSSLRNQGASGVVETARIYLAALPLLSLKEVTPSDYPKWLDARTTELQVAFPDGAKDKWGAARKALNIFMVHAFLNRELSTAFDLSRFGEVMETPLDRMAGENLRERGGNGRLPKWPGVGCLTPAISAADYQAFAAELAVKEQIPRACLDMILWRPETR